MAYRRLKSSRSRLLAILLSVLVPIASLMALAAWSNYRFTSTSVLRDYGLFADSSTTKVRVWLRGVERTLITAATALDVIREDNAACTAAAQNIVRTVFSMRALVVRFHDGRECGFAAQGYSASGMIERVDLGSTYSSNGPEISEGRLLLEPQGTTQSFVLRVVAVPANGGPAWVALAVMDPAGLKMTLKSGETHRGSSLGIVLNDGGIVTTTDDSTTPTGWFPSSRMIGSGPQTAGGRDGLERVYISAPLVNDAFYVLAGFDQEELRQARNQFLILLVMPLIVLASLALVFMRAIDLYVVRWLGQIAGAVHERSQLKSARVDISREMPDEIRDFATAFNDMAQAEETRRKALEKALEENRFLMRELHHRIKNSLQVIQSYIAIEARDKSGAVRHALTDAELRVRIMAIAYRTAMADGTIRALDLNDFLIELMPALDSRLSRSHIVRQVLNDIGVKIELEKVIALGFLVADAFARASDAAERSVLTIELQTSDAEDGLMITAEPFIRLGPPPRINRGLLLQLHATETPADPETGIICGWKWARTSIY